MEFREYQERALQTEQTPAVPGTEVIIPLLGLAGEAGELLSEYKKHLRDGEAHRLFKERVAEELGDLLWYLADVAGKFDLELEDVARSNLAKCQDRWGSPPSSDAARASFDEGFPESERLPQKLEVEFTTLGEGGTTKMRAFILGERVGDDLTDNAHSEDGYRFHDVFHLACAAVLGWSPVLRSLLKRKRKSRPRIDEVEDGGRATAIEEGISALLFSYAANHSMLEGIASLDYHLLRTIREMTRHLEVSARPVGDWERAILAAYRVWREVERHGGGYVSLDLEERSITFAGPGEQG